MFHCYCYPGRSPAPTRTKGGITGGSDAKEIGSLATACLLACARPWEYMRGFWRPTNLDGLGCSTGLVDTVGVRGGDALEKTLGMGGGSRVDTGGRRCLSGDDERLWYGSGCLRVVVSHIWWFRPLACGSDYPPGPA